MAFLSNSEANQIWWRRRELNPRPKILLAQRLHAYSRSRFPPSRETFAGRAQNGQETRKASLVVSPPAPRRSARSQPAVRRPSPAHGRSRGGRLLNQLSSVCQFSIGNCCFARDHGCMRPGMPLGRKHFRRSRDAPTEARSAPLAVCKDLFPI